MRTRRGGHPAKHNSKTRYAFGAYWVPAADVQAAKEADWSLDPWIYLGRLGISVGSLKAGIHVLHTFWGSDEQSAREALIMTALQSDVSGHKYVMTMGYPKEMLDEFRQTHDLRVATFDVEGGRPTITKESLMQLPHLGW